MEFKDYAWPALQLMGIGAFWLTKAGVMATLIVIYVMFELMRVALVAVMFGRLPRNWMRHL